MSLFSVTVYSLFPQNWHAADVLYHQQWLSQFESLLRHCSRQGRGRQIPWRIPLCFFMNRLYVSSFCWSKSTHICWWLLCEVFLDPEGGSQKATLVLVVVVVGISSLRVQKIPKAFLICSGAQRNFATHSCWHCSQVYSHFSLIF